MEDIQFERLDPNVQIVLIIAIAIVVCISVYSYFKWLRDM